MALAFKPLTEQQLSALSQQQLDDYFSSMRSAIWQNDPGSWARDRLGAQWWSAQHRIGKSLVKNARTAVHACHDSSKSYTAASLACWWIDSHIPGEAFVVTTAPTNPQVKAILWREINRLHALGNLPGRVNLTEWYIPTPGGGEELVAFGRKPQDDDTTGFHGIHAKYVLVILDEAGGIPLALWDGVDTLTTNEHARILAIGNPDDPNSRFAQICKGAPGWHIEHIDGLKTPNFTEEKYELSQDILDCLLSERWVADMAALHGVDSAFYVAKVRGLFPSDAADGFIPFSFIAQCRQESERADATGLKVLGVDVGAGGDETVCTLRHGDTFVKSWNFNNADAMETVGEIASIARLNYVDRVNVDSIGVGHGVFGRLNELAEQGELLCEVFGVNVGLQAVDKDRFVNLKAELWWAAREQARLKIVDLRAMSDQTVTELCEHQIGYDSRGRTKVEAKDDVKARLGRSPDNADAWILTHFKPEVEKKRPRMTFRG